MSELQNSLKIALVQMTSGESPAQNLEQILDLLSGIDTSNLDWVCLPENSLYNKVKNSSDGFSLQAAEIVFLQNMAKEKGFNFHLGAIPLKDPTGVSNATLLITSDGNLQVVYRKIHLFDMKMGAISVKESDQFIPGDQPAFFDWKGWRFGFSICYDLRFSELFLYYSQNNVDLIFAPSAFTKVTGKSHWQALIKGRAIENQAYMVAAAQAGTAEVDGVKRSSYGHSMVVSSWGEELVHLSNSGPAIEVVTLDKSQVVKTRSILPVNNHRRLKVSFDI